jgi:predicted nucleic acid-binding protein
MIVVDSNILSYLYLPGDFTAAAEALFNRDCEWVAPLLWRSEFSNILAGYLRKKLLTFEQVMNIQLEAESLMSGAEYEVNSAAALELVHDSDCSAYDCEFVALANSLGTKLLTVDKKLLRAFAPTAVALAEA